MTGFRTQAQDFSLCPLCPDQLRLTQPPILDILESMSEYEQRVRTCQWKSLFCKDVHVVYLQPLFVFWWYCALCSVLYTCEEEHILLNFFLKDDKFQSFYMAIINHTHSFQNRLQRCIMQCNDDIRDKMGPNPTDAEVSYLFQYNFITIIYSTNFACTLYGDTMKTAYYEICTFWSQALQINLILMYTASVFDSIPRVVFGCFVSMDLSQPSHIIIFNFFYYCRWVDTARTLKNVQWNVLIATWVSCQLFWRRWRKFWQAVDTSSAEMTWIY
jgi:hypothetical protein